MLPINIPVIIATSASFTVALAWNEAFKTAIHELLLPTKETILSMFAYAIITSIIVILFLIVISHAEKTVSKYTNNHSNTIANHID